MLLAQATDCLLLRFCSWLVRLWYWLLIFYLSKLKNDLMRLAVLYLELINAPLIIVSDIAYIKLVKTGISCGFPVALPLLYEAL